MVIGPELGRGVFGQVFKGTLRGSVVAVKQLKDKLKDLTQFETEITIMTKIRHPNVVLFMGASFDPPLIVTEYLEGGDLHETITSYHAKLENRDLIPMADAVKLAVGIAKGMSWLHQSIPPIIHKDLKPKNVMIDSHGTPKIIDFGLSEIQTQREIEKKKIAGSASWMAPEMLKGDVYTEKLDVYAFGIMIWQLFTGSIKVYDTTKYDGLQANVAFQAFINDICDQRVGPSYAAAHPKLFESQPPPSCAHRRVLLGPQP
uniref:Protein kinase domain-containing protein n=1 Tax=Arcella intermedia TaxID=1963864 RepID=A0A6B2LCX5_9EUKA